MPGLFIEHLHLVLVGGASGDWSVSPITSLVEHSIHSPFHTACRHVTVPQQHHNTGFLC
jgi:hypothetical protein